MKRPIPVSIGYHSGLTDVPDAMIEFKDEEIQQRLMHAMLEEDRRFTVSVSATRGADGQLRMQEIRFLPEQKVKIEPSGVPSASFRIEEICKHHAPGEKRCNMHNLHCTYPKCLEIKHDE